MKKWIAIAALMLVFGMLLVPMLASAASTLYIDILATGSEVTITCNCTSYDFGTVEASDNIVTAVTYCRLTNSTSEAVEITIHGNEMVDIATGAAEVWALSNTQTPGANTIAMWLAVDDTDDNWGLGIDDESGDDNKIAYDADTTLSAAATWDFGLCFLAPTSSVGNSAMVMSDDGGTDHAQVDVDNGLVLVATVPP